MTAKPEPVRGESVLARFSIDQSQEDAAEIGLIIRAALRDCKVSQDLRARLAGVLDRADRIARNLTNGGEPDNARLAGGGA